MFSSLIDYIGTFQMTVLCVLSGKKRKNTNRVTILKYWSKNKIDTSYVGDFVLTADEVASNDILYVIGTRLRTTLPQCTPVDFFTLIFFLTFDFSLPY